MDFGTKIFLPKIVTGAAKEQAVKPHHGVMFV